MNKATQDAIRDRLRDRVQKDFNLLRDYIDTDDLFILAECAMDMRLWPLDDERHQKAIDAFDRVFNAVMDNYFDHKSGEELLSFREYLKGVETENSMEAL